MFKHCVLVFSEAEGCCFRVLKVKTFQGGSCASIISIPRVTRCQSEFNAGLIRNPPQGMGCLGKQSLFS